MGIRRANDERIEGTPDGLNAVTEIMDVPDAPTIGAATNVGTSRAYNDGSATVAFTAPTTGGTPTTYTATSTPGSFTGTAASSPVTVTGLQSATGYTFTVKGTNTNSVTGPDSAASSSITATTVPQAPTIGTATVNSTTNVSLAFTDGATGGSAITSYSVTSSPSISLTVSGSTSPLSVTGTFAGGQAYTFTVNAVNANGTSTASSASNSITPLSGDFVSIGTAISDGSSTVLTVSGIPNTYKHLLIRTIERASTTAQSKLSVNTGQNYGQQIVYGVNTTVAGDTLTTANGLYTSSYASNFASGYTHVSETIIPEYTLSSSNKNMIGTGGGVAASGSPNDWEFLQWAGATQNAMGAITSVTLTRVSGTFSSGSRIAVYGIGS
jgi:hypothetical protein